MSPAWLRAPACFLVVLALPRLCLAAGGFQSTGDPRLDEDRLAADSAYLANQFPEFPQNASVDWRDVAKKLGAFENKARADMPGYEPDENSQIRILSPSGLNLLAFRPKTNDCSKPWIVTFPGSRFNIFSKWDGTTDVSIALGIQGSLARIDTAEFDSFIRRFAEMADPRTAAATKCPSVKILSTGFSLGGALAEAFSTRLALEIAKRGKTGQMIPTEIHTVTFDGLGAKNYFNKKNSLADASSQRALAEVGASARNYRMLGEALDLPHLGQDCVVNDEKMTTRNAVLRISESLKQSPSILANAAQLGFELYEHDMSALRQAVIDGATSQVDCTPLPPGYLMRAVSQTCGNCNRAAPKSTSPGD